MRYNIAHQLQLSVISYYHLYAPKRRHYILW